MKPRNFLRELSSRRSSLALVALVALLLTGCVGLFERSKISSHREGLWVMTYNVENLFDTEHDHGKEDFAYLPLAKKVTRQHKNYCQSLRFERWRNDCLFKDWSQSVLDTKMERLADVILQVNQGRGPDVLILEEVENKKVLEQLNQRFLGPANYKSIVLIEGNDKRGIDIGFLSRLPLVGTPQLHTIPFQALSRKDREGLKDTRGILQAEFRLPDQQVLSVFGVHLPAPYHPTYLRKQAIQFLGQLTSQLPEDRMIVVGGDFNITSEEEQREEIYDELSRSWQVSHKLGCHSCPGTNYYHPKRQWSFLDALLFSQNMSEGSSQRWVLDRHSIHIPKGSPYQNNQYRSPARYSPRDSFGVSDHWPVAAQIYPRKRQITQKESEQDGGGS